jgi:hypothetical protein
MQNEVENSGHKRHLGAAEYYQLSRAKKAVKSFYLTSALLSATCLSQARALKIVYTSIIPFEINVIDIDFWNLGCIKIDDEVGGALSLESPAVKYSIFIAPIVVIDPLVWIEI